MLVYRGNFDMRAPAGLAEVMLAKNASDGGLGQQWIEHAQKAVDLIPDFGIAHAELCKALSANGKWPLAIKECRIAHIRLSEDPVSRKRDLQRVDQALFEATARNQQMHDGDPR